MRQARRIFCTVIAGAGIIVGSAVAGLAQSASTANAKIGVSRIAVSADLAKPAGVAWKKIKETRVGVDTAFPAHPSITGDASIHELRVQAAQTNTDLYIRIRWDDPTPNRERSIGQFADGVGVEFAANESAETQPFMGGDGKRVNIWYWNAARDSFQNLIADGFGTLTPAAKQDVLGTASYDNGIWTVVFRRSLRNAEGDDVPLLKKAGTKLPVAFAVWNGGNMERDGFKAVTLEWQELQF